MGPPNLRSREKKSLKTAFLVNLEKQHQGKGLDTLRGGGRGQAERRRRGVKVFWGVTWRQAGLLTARGTRVTRPRPCRSLAADKSGWQRPAGRKKKTPNLACSLFTAISRAAGRGEAPSTVPGSFFLGFFFLGGRGEARMQL